MTMSRNAVGNLITRYKSVLQNCSLLNVFGTLALAGVMVVGGASGALAQTIEDITAGKEEISFAPAQTGDDWCFLQKGLSGEDFSAYIIKQPAKYNEKIFSNILIGGWYIGSINHGDETKNSNFLIDGGCFQTLAGGNCLFTSTVQSTTFGTTNLTIIDIDYSEYLVGGTTSNGVPNGGSTSVAGTNLTILGGTIGDDGTAGEGYGNGGHFGLVGGNYIKDGRKDTVFNSTVGTTNVVIGMSGGNNADILAKDIVVAGSHADNYNTNLKHLTVTDTNTNLTILSGTFGGVPNQGTSDTNDLLEEISLAGGSMALGGGSVANVTGTATVTVAEGIFKGKVFAGGIAITKPRTNAIPSEKTTTASVATTKLVISGGTFSDAVYGGGYADATGTNNTATSTVTTATMDISGGTFNGDVYAGGCGVEGGTATVETSTVNITGGKFSGTVYGQGNGAGSTVTTSTLNFGSADAGYNATLNAFQDFTNVNIIGGANVGVAKASFGADSTFTVGADAKFSASDSINVAAGASLVVAGDFTADKVTIAGAAWGIKDDAYDKDSTTLTSSSAIVTIKDVTYEGSTYTVTTGVADSATISKELGSSASSGTVELVSSALENQAANPTAAQFIVEAAKQDNGGAIIDDATKIASKGAVLPGLANVNTAATTNMGTRTSIVPQAKVTAASETSTWLAMDGDGAILPAADGGNMAQGFGIWFMPMYNNTSADGFKSDSNEYGYDTNIVGATLGSDYTFASDLRLGLAFNVGQGSSTSTGGATTTDNDFDFFGLSAYGAKHFDQFGLSFDMGYTVSQNEMQQDNPTGDLSGDVDAALFTVGLKAEYQIPLDSFNMTPYAGIRFNYYDVDAYDTMKGGASLFSTESSDSTVWEIPVGVTFDTTTKVGSWDMTPSLGLGVKFAMGDLDAEQEVSVTDVPGSSILSSEVADEVTFQGALGLGFAKDNCTIGFNYNLDLSENVESHGLSVNLRYDF